MVGAKNMHSSSGCAVIRSVGPTTSLRQHFPPNFFQSTRHAISRNVMKIAAAEKNILEMK